MNILNIKNFCVAVLVAVFVCSCDKDADNAKTVMVSGVYDGNIIAELYMPDYSVELYNSYTNPNGAASVACDTIQNGKVEVHFASDDNASFRLNDLSEMKFRVPFLYVYDNLGEADVQLSMTDGMLAKFHEIVERHYFNGELTKDEFMKYAHMLEYIEDTIKITDMSVPSFRMRERGAMYSTYDYEQNSIYVLSELNEFKYSRKTNLDDVIAYVESKLGARLMAEEKALVQIMKEKLVLSGSISGAKAWISMAYSNFRPVIEMTIEHAPGILDVLTTALYGENKTDDYGNELKDADGNPIPNKSMILQVYYEGSIANMNSYERIEE